MHYRLPHPSQGASSHLNFNASNLSTIFDKRLFPYVHVGDGKSIPVTNTGHIIIPSHHRPLHLHNVLLGRSLSSYQAVNFSHCFSLDKCFHVASMPQTFGPLYLPQLTKRLSPTIRPSNAEPNTPTPQGPTPTNTSPSPQSTVPTSIAHNHGSDPSTSAHQTSQLPPPTFDFPNPQPNIETVHEPPRTHPMITRLQSSIVKPIDHLSLHTSSISPIPKNPSHALKDPNWHNAMYDEYNALVKNGTWLLVPRPAGVNMVRSMWFFKHKFHADGTLSRYKARLVANDSSQQLGVNFDETFSPVIKPATIRTVLSLVVSRQWPIHQLDIKNAFLNEIFIWTETSTSCLVSAVCRVAYLLIYVDDIILTASCPTLLQQIISSLHNEFDITDLGALNYFLGISADRTPTESKLGPEVQQICLYMHDPREPHLAALKSILRYVKGTLDLGLHLYASSTTSLVGYTDADWAGYPSTRRSTSGYCVFLGDNLLSWSAKRQHTLSRSSAEAEYRGVANIVA
ncbi:ribonuclease H-like domain-containing protein [Tanacetum coccineum]